MRTYLLRQLGRPSGLIGRWVMAPLWNRRNAALNDAAFGALDVRPGDRVLEVGFGGGYLLRRLADAASDGCLAGIDASPAMVAYCTRRLRRLVEAGRLELHCAGAERLPFPDGHFTALCSVNSIFYWSSAPRAIGEFWRVLAEGGRLVLCFTLPQSLRGRALAGGVTAYDAAEVEAMVAAAGFRAVHITSGADRHRVFACLAATK